MEKEKNIKSKKEAIRFAKDTLVTSLSQDLCKSELEMNGFTYIEIVYSKKRFFGKAQYNGETINF